MRRVKSVAKPTRRKTRRVRRISPAVPKSARPVEAQAQQVADRRGAGWSGLRAHPCAGGRDASAALAAQILAREIRRPRQADRGGAMKPPLTDPPPDLEWGTDYDTKPSAAKESHPNI